MDYSYAQIAGSTAIARSDGAILPADPSNRDYQSYLSWVAAGHQPAAPSTPTPQQQMQFSIQAAALQLQQLLDLMAQSWGYDNVVSAISYLASGNPRFRAEAQAMLDWRDQVWSWAETLELDVQNGIKSLPATMAEFLAQMPAPPARPSVTM
jgi:hypothetical protein